MVYALLSSGGGINSQVIILIFYDHTIKLSTTIYIL